MQFQFWSLYFSCIFYTIRDYWYYSLFAIRVFQTPLLLVPEKLRQYNWIVARVTSILNLSLGAFSNKKNQINFYEVKIQFVVYCQTPSDLSSQALGNIRLYSEIFRNLQNGRKWSCSPLTSFFKIFGNLRKVDENRRNMSLSVCLYNKKITEGCS